MLHQVTNRVVMIRPDHFGFNPQTSKDNDWQHIPQNELTARNAALSEFDTMVKTLQEEEITVAVLSSRTDAVTPDAVFPNNWFSVHEFKDRSKLIVYPMRTPNRRAERQVTNVLEALKKIGVTNCEVIDLSSDEDSGNILEGTGSMVLDRRHKIAYAIEAQRTIKEEFAKWCQELGFEGILFQAKNIVTNNPIYHTNLAMAIGDGFAVLCSEAITDEKERMMVRDSLKKHGELIEITLTQLGKFCGNIIQLRSKNGDHKIIMSQGAFDAFLPSQREILKKYGKLVPVSLPTIESVGGGSARCMTAEVFPPAK